MEEWARLKNIEHFERDLSVETDPDKRRQLQEFIDQERTRIEEIRRAKRGQRK